MTNSFGDEFPPLFDTVDCYLYNKFPSSIVVFLSFKNFEGDLGYRKGLRMGEVLNNLSELLLKALVEDYFFVGSLGSGGN